MNRKINSANTNGTATLTVNNPALHRVYEQAIRLLVNMRPVETWEVPLHRKRTERYSAPHVATPSLRLTRPNPNATE